MFSRLEEKLYKILYYFCSFLMFSMLTIIFTQVVFRYVFQNSISWSEELGRYIFVWMTFFGAVLALRRRSHVSLDSLINQFPPWLFKAIKVFGYILMIVFAAVLFYNSFTMLQLGARQLSAAMQIPMKYVYYALPISTALLVLYLFRNLIEDIKQWKG
ncbi:TRAP transporter small permease [Desulfitibacter alkalitolerans]|uniref:TRAP transporter small permease n=1 Tax=Desulfitibacter alkalitolerans TaxID=264641 RepID=UPI0004828A0C|nr:TRAP transporter small permease [Desulfitibacter alkalitolerans]